jgi:glycosylphosphatidylinositol transamidase
VATQKYNYTVSNHTFANENVYAILQGPRADATEAIVLIGAWKNIDDEVNNSGVALVLTLARYFKRWSLWSKDIIFLIPADSTIGSQAWVDAYHNEHNEKYVESLKIKSGALQGAVAIDYPAGPWGHRYDKLHIMYDGINGQLPNLDLINTAIGIADGQMGITCAIQRMFSAGETYKDKLTTMARGMISQGLGHATGPHSSFIPYHVDAITLVTVGDGWHDEMSLGRTVESLFRSLNNLLEHLHQSFFFYLLLEAKRFVSIGTYLPSAMLLAMSFSIMAMSLWVQSGRPEIPVETPLSERPRRNQKAAAATETKPAVETTLALDDLTSTSAATETQPLLAADTETTILKSGSDITVVPATTTSITERRLLLPLLLLLIPHLIGLVPLHHFNTHDLDFLPPVFITAANFTTLLPFFAAWVAYYMPSRQLPLQTITLVQCFSLLVLGLFLAALSTLNFSLSFLIGVLASPLAFVRRSDKMGWTVLQSAMLALLNPVLVAQWGCSLVGADLATVLREAAVGWAVYGLRTQVVVWLVWFPAWVVGSTIVAGGFFL